MRSIRERILKEVGGEGERRHKMCCSEVDPGEDTESEKGPQLGVQPDELQ